MDKKILSAASYYKKSYFFDNAEFAELPKGIQDELRIMTTIAAEKIMGIVSAGFYEDGTVFVEATGASDDFDYDEIGAQWMIDELVKEKKELIKSLQLWFVVYKTTDGKAALEELTKENSVIDNGVDTL